MEDQELPKGQELGFIGTNWTDMAGASPARALGGEAGPQHVMTFRGGTISDVALAWLDHRPQPGQNVSP